ncbi:MAG TPA: hypothetical protein VMZ91_15615 [Candidatus Paceibacterota bacterium]|nr:hypothetical protein [Candidatus Paceibacterota bacterium]
MANTTKEVKVREEVTYEEPTDKNKKKKKTRNKVIETKFGNSNAWMSPKNWK